ERIPKDERNVSAFVIRISGFIRHWSFVIWNPHSSFRQRLWTLAFGLWTLEWRPMVVELINTGSELMLGRVLNTHQQWLCRQLADLGCVVSRQVAVADEGRDIEQAVREALSRADLVITTGGLGPTSDDITRDLIARLLSKELEEDPEVLAHIKTFFDVSKRIMPDRTR